MKRNLKALGLALAATFAMSAVAASGASAGVKTDLFHADGQDTFLTAEAIGAQVFKDEANAAEEFVCNEVDVKGTIKEKTEEKVTVVPLYNDCRVVNASNTAEVLANASVDTNDCGYEFTGTTDANGHAEVTIECDSPTSTGITIRVSGFNVECVHVLPQEVNGISYGEGLVETPGGSFHKDIKLKATVTGITSETTHNAFVCPTESGGTETVHTGTYDGEVTVTGFNNEAHTERTSIWVG